jgi:intracellular septation protein A
MLAYYASERVWVNFKVFGLTILTLVFVGAQVIYLTRRSEEPQQVQEPPPA